MGPKPPRPPPARTPGYRRGHVAREGDSSWELSPGLRPASRMGPPRFLPFLLILW